MADSIKISELDPIGYSNLSVDDQFIINDAGRTDSQILTRNVTLGEIVTYFTKESLTFSPKTNNPGDINTITFDTRVEVVFNDKATFNGPVVFNDSVTFTDPVEFGDIEFTGTITGISLDDLDDVNASSPSNGDSLVWEDSSGSWKPGASGGGDTSPGPLLDQRYLVHIGTTPTTPVVDGMLWLDITDSTKPELKVYYSGNWTLTRPSGLLIGDSL